MSDQGMTLLDTIKPKSDQLNYDDLIAGPIDVTIANLRAGDDQQPVIVVVDGGYQPFKPCKSMRRVMIAAWGDKGKDWLGKRMRLYGDPNVKFGGVAVGGIRISHVSGIDKPLNVLLTLTRSKREPFVVNPISQPTTPASGRT